MSSSTFLTSGSQDAADANPVPGAGLHVPCPSVQQLEPVTDPSSTIDEVHTLLGKPREAWRAHFDALSLLRRLVAHHSNELKPHLATILPRVTKQLEVSLHPSVIMNGFTCLREIAIAPSSSGLRPELDRDMGSLLLVLLEDREEVLEEEAEVCLKAMLKSSAALNATLMALVSCADSKHEGIRSKVAYYLEYVFRVHGSKVLLSSSYTDLSLLRALGSYLSKDSVSDDYAMDMRKSAKLVLALMVAFDGVAKVQRDAARLPPSLLKQDIEKVLERMANGDARSDDEDTQAEEEEEEEEEEKQKEAKPRKKKISMKAKPPAAAGKSKTKTKRVGRPKEPVAVKSRVKRSYSAGSNKSAESSGSEHSNRNKRTPKSKSKRATTPVRSTSAERSASPSITDSVSSVNKVKKTARKVPSRSLSKSPSGTASRSLSKSPKSLRPKSPLLARRVSKSPKKSPSASGDRSFSWSPNRSTAQSRRARSGSHVGLQLNAAATTIAYDLATVDKGGRDNSRALEWGADKVQGGRKVVKKKRVVGVRSSSSSGLTDTVARGRRTVVTNMRKSMSKSPVNRGLNKSPLSAGSSGSRRISGRAKSPLNPVSTNRDAASRDSSASRSPIRNGGSTGQHERGSLKPEFFRAVSAPSPAWEDKEMKHQTVKKRGKTRVAKAISLPVRKVDGAVKRSASVGGRKRSTSTDSAGKVQARTASAALLTETTKVGAEKRGSSISTRTKKKPLVRTGSDRDVANQTAAKPLQRSPADKSSSSSSLGSGGSPSKPGLRKKRTSGSGYKKSLSTGALEEDKQKQQTHSANDSLSSVAEEVQKTPKAKSKSPASAASSSNNKTSPHGKAAAVEPVQSKPETPQEDDLETSMSMDIHETAVHDDDQLTNRSLEDVDIFEPAETPQNTYRMNKQAQIAKIIRPVNLQDAMSNKRRPKKKLEPERSRSVWAMRELEVLCREAATWLEQTLRSRESADAATRPADRLISFSSTGSTARNHELLDEDEEKALFRLEAEDVAAMFLHELQDGVILCKVLLLLYSEHPAVKPILGNFDFSPFALPGTIEARANLNLFATAAAAILQDTHDKGGSAVIMSSGADSARTTTTSATATTLSAPSMFSADDIFSNKNHKKVAMGILALAREAYVNRGIDAPDIVQQELDVESRAALVAAAGKGNGSSVGYTPPLSEKEEVHQTAVLKHLQDLTRQLKLDVKVSMIPGSSKGFLVSTVVRRKPDPAAAAGGNSTDSDGVTVTSAIAVRVLRGVAMARENDRWKAFVRYCRVFIADAAASVLKQTIKG